MIHVLVFVIEWSLMDTQLHDFSQQISEVAVVMVVVIGKVVHSQARSLIVRMFLADVGGKSFVATGGGGGTGGIGRGPASVKLPSGWHS